MTKKEIYADFKKRYPVAVKVGISYQEYSTDEILIKIPRTAQIIYNGKTHRFVVVKGEFHIGPEDYANYMAKIIVERMEKDNLTREDLWERSHISRTELSKYINGTKLPNLYDLARLADAIGVSVSDLSLIG